MTTVYSMLEHERGQLVPRSPLARGVAQAFGARPAQVIHHSQAAAVFYVRQRQLQSGLTK